MSSQLVVSLYHATLYSRKRTLFPELHVTARGPELDFRDFDICSSSRKTIVPFGLHKYSSSPGGGGTPLYGLYRYVRSQRVWFFSRFGHK